MFKRIYVEEGRVTRAELDAPLAIIVASAKGSGAVTNGGAEGIRTPDPLLAKQVLSQLSYSPRLTLRL